MKDKGQWENLGNELRDLVEDAITSNNYSELSKNITNIVNSSIDEVRVQIRNSVNSASYNSTPIRDLNSVIKTPKQNALVVRPKGKGGALAKEIIGYCSGGGFLISALGTFGIAATQHFMAAATLAASACFGLASMAFIGLGISGTTKRGKIKRFNQYLRTLGNNLYYDIEDFARNLGYSEKQIRKDLKAMIREGIFKEGHLDKQETCLIVSDQMYDQYLETQQNYEAAEKQKAAASAYSTASNTSTEAKMTAECRLVLKEGEEHIQHINYCRSLMHNPEMRGKLDRLSKVISRIFDVVKKDPDKVSDLHRMMNFYLPTTKKLLTAYCELENQPVAGTNIESTKKEIESSLDTLNDAFEQLLDDLFQDTAWDISSDISVLNTMLAQDGYAGDKIKL